jgi:hypothetical protein
MNKLITYRTYDKPSDTTWVTVSKNGVVVASQTLAGDQRKLTRKKIINLLEIRMEVSKHE